MIKRLVTVIFAALLFAGCSSSISGDNSTKPEAQTSSRNDAGEAFYLTAYDKNESAADAPSIEQTAGDADTGSQEERKIIKNAKLTLAVKNFDDAVDGLKNMTEAAGGYTENFSYSSYTQNGTEYKRGGITLRVPSESFDYVTDMIKQLGKVSSFYSSAEDSSDTYYDIERRLEMKLAEEERLLDMISKASKIEDLIALEQRLSDIRSTIESYKGRLLGIDRLVAYSTISIDLTENADEVIKPVSDDLLSRIADSFKASVNGIIDFFEIILVLLAGLALPLLVISLPVIAGVLIHRRIKRKSSSGPPLSK